MKRVVLALVLGVAFGYNWGFGEGHDGKASVVTRTLERFGTAKVKAAQDAKNRKVEEASKP